MKLPFIDSDLLYTGVLSGVFDYIYLFELQYYILLYIHYLPFPEHSYLAYMGKLFPSVVYLESNGSHIRI
jgi:hypothetical protein